MGTSLRKKPGRKLSSSSSPFFLFFKILLPLGLWLSTQCLLWNVLEHRTIQTKTDKFYDYDHDHLNENKNTKSAMLKEFSTSGRTRTTTSSRFQNQTQANPKKMLLEKQPPSLQSDKNDKNIHIVFSTDCSGYQHWQGILLYYSALRVNQQGTITRIASGCTLEEQTRLQAEWQRIDPSKSKFQIHFAPSTAFGHKYKYSNKPGGLLHWLQHNNNNTGVINDDAVICLLDPDMILLKPITPQLVAHNWKVRNKNIHQVEWMDPATNIAQVLRVASLQDTGDAQAPTRVQTGFPAGQHFGVGGAWVQGMAKHARAVWQHFDKSKVCCPNATMSNMDNNSHHYQHCKCTLTSPSDAHSKYAVGPVYLATLEDWKRIAATWMEFVPHVHQQYPYLLAEMYSLTMAVADLELPWFQVSNYMITGGDVTSPTEGWTWIDDIIKQQQQQQQSNATNTIPKNNVDNNNLVHQICQGVDHYQPPTYTQDSSQLALPNTLHYCQRYNLEFDAQSFLFSKRKIPHDVFSCSDDAATTLPPVPFDIHELLSHAAKAQSSYWTTTQRRTLFALCHVSPILNWARQQYQEHACSSSSSSLG